MTTEPRARTPRQEARQRIAGLHGLQLAIAACVLLIASSAVLAAGLAWRAEDLAWFRRVGTDLEAERDPLWSWNRGTGDTLSEPDRRARLDAIDERARAVGERYRAAQWRRERSAFALAAVLMLAAMAVMWTWADARRGSSKRSDGSPF